MAFRLTVSNVQRFRLEHSAAALREQGEPRRIGLLFAGAGGDLPPTSLIAEPMTPSHPQLAPPLTPIGGRYIYAGYIFECAARFTYGECAHRTVQSALYTSLPATAQGPPDAPVPGRLPRFHRRPPPLVIVNEKWTAAEWLSLIIVLALAVAGIWLWSSGTEARKWKKIEATSRAIQGR